MATVTTRRERSFRNRSSHFPASRNRRRVTNPSRTRRLVLESLEGRTLLAGFNFDDFSSAANLTLLHDAITTPEHTLQLTKPEPKSRGNVWYSAKQFVSVGFESTFDFRMSGGDERGMAFVIQNEGPMALGREAPGGYAMIANSVAVEFDTSLHVQHGDINDNHVGVQTNGSAYNTAQAAQSLGSAIPAVDMNDGNVHTARVRYVPGSLSVYVDDLTNPVLTVAIDLSQTLNLDLGRAWVGLTAASWGQDGDVLNWDYVSLENTAAAVGIWDASIAEAHAGMSDLIFTVSRLGDTSATTTLDWTVSDGTATSPTDYSAAGGQVTFGPGEFEKTIAVPVAGDVAQEGNETLLVNLSLVSGSATLVDALATGTILNDDSTITISDAVAIEASQAWQFVDEFVPAVTSTLAQPRYTIFGPDGHLYVVSRLTDDVQRFDGTTGEFLGVFADNAPTSWADDPRGIVFGPDGHLYVAGHDDRVMRFDGQTGAYIDDFVAVGAGGLERAEGVTFGPDGHLYVADRDAHKVFRFHGTTGAYIDDFIPAGSGGLSLATAVVFGPDGNLYVGDADHDQILRYNGTTGEFLDVFVPPSANGLFLPQAIVFGPDGDLYVSSTNSHTVQRYDTETGAFIETVASLSANGFALPNGLAFGVDGMLYVSSASAPTVGTENPILRYGSKSLAVLEVTLSSPTGVPVTVSYGTASGTAVAGSDFAATSGTVTFAPGQTSRTILVQTLDDTFYEGNETFTVNLSNSVGGVIVDGQGIATIQENDPAPQVSISDATATEVAVTFLDTMVAPGSGGLWAPRGIDYGPDGNLYINSDYNPSNPSQTAGVNRYDAVTGQLIDRFATLPASIGAKDVEFGPDGNLYVPTQQTHSVYRFNGSTGELIDVFVPAGSGGLHTARSLVFGPDGNGDNYPDAYVTSAGSDSVLRYDGQTGAFLDAFVPSGSGGLNDPTALVFGPDGDLYVASGAHSDFFNGILRFDGLTGAFKSTFVPAGSAGLTLAPTAGVIFGPDINGDAAPDLYVSNGEVDEVLIYNGLTGAYLQKFVPPGLGGLNDPKGLLFDQDGNLLVVNNGDFSVRRFSVSSQAAFMVSLPAPTDNAVTVSYSTVSGTATAGSDFAANSGTITFAPGQTTRRILVQTLDDTVYEGNETFTFNLSNPVGGVIVDGQGVGMIVENDPQPTRFYVVDDASANKTFEYGDSGSGIDNYDLSGGNSAPRGAAATSAGDKVWVVDANRTVYVYDASGGLLGSWSVSGFNTSAQFTGIAVSGNSVWIVDAKSDKVYRFDNAASLLSGSKSANGSFALNSGNKDASDLVTDGTSIWVVNNATQDKVFKYTLNGTLLGSWTISGGGGSPTGITLDPAAPSHLWIVDSVTDRVYQYDGAVSRTGGSQSSSTSFALAADNTNPQGIADPPVVLNPGSEKATVKTNAAAECTDRALAEVLAVIPSGLPWHSVQHASSTHSQRAPEPPIRPSKVRLALPTARPSVVKEQINVSTKRTPTVIATEADAVFEDWVSLPWAMGIESDGR